MKRLVLGSLVLTLAACGGPPAGRAPQPAAPTVERLRAEGDERLGRRDWAGAVRAYEQALLYAPDDVHARYRLGIALAHLERTEEAVTAFTWVADHGAPDSEEVRVAREWLVAAGVRPAARAAAGPAAEEPSPGGGLEGRTEWKNLDPGRPRPGLQILLEGDEPVTRGRRYWTKVPLNDPYRIPGIVPGRYRLMAQVGPFRLWDTTVVVQDGGPTRVDLTPATSVAPPDVLRPAS